MYYIIKDLLKVSIMCFIRFLCLAFYIIPVKKNRIVLRSFNKRFACNQKYLFLELYERYKDSLEFVFVMDKELNLLNKELVGKK